MTNPLATRPRLAAVLLLAGILALALYPLWLGRFYAVGDMHDVFIPLEDFFRREQLNQRPPLWNPDMSWGFPVIASAQIGFWYPPLLLLRFLPLPIYLPIILYGHLLLAAYGTFLFARRRNVSLAGSTLAALSFTLSTFIFQHLTHLNIILNIAWLPWQFVILHELVRAASPRRRQLQAAAAAVLALPFLAGHLHISALIAAASLFYYLSQHPKPRPRALTTILPVMLLLAALAAPQILPTLELAQHSTRAAGGAFKLDHANQHSWPLYHLPTVVWPRFFGTDDTYWGKRLEVEYGIFIGTIPLLLAVWAAARREHEWRFFSGLAIAGFILALGDMSPVRLVGLEPTLWYFSAPARWLLLYTFGVSLLAGRGLDLLTAHRQTLARVSLRVGLVLTAFAVASNAIIWNLPADLPERTTAWLADRGALGERPAAYYEDKLASLITSTQEHSVSLTSWYTWLPLLSLLLLPQLVHRRHAQAWLVGIAALELTLIAATSNPTVPWHNILTPPASIPLLPSDVQKQQARLLSLPRPGDTGLFLSNPGSRADAAERAQLRELLIPLTHARFNIAGAAWPASLDLQAQRGILSRLSLAELNVGAVIADPAAEQTPGTYHDKHEHGELIIYDIAAEPRAALVTETATTPLPYQPQTPTKLAWSVDTPVPAQLILRDTYYPGWQATIDGQPAPIEPHESIFRRVAVPAGQHTITMTYQPRWLYAGLAAAGVAALVMAGLLWPRRGPRV